MRLIALANSIILIIAGNIFLFLWLISILFGRETLFSIRINHVNSMWRRQVRSWNGIVF